MKIKRRATDGLKMKLTVVHMRDIIGVVIANEDADNVVFGLWRDGGRVPLDGIFGASHPEFSSDGSSDFDGKLDRGDTSFDDGGISNRRCSRQRDEGKPGEGRETKCNEPHNGSS